MTTMGITVARNENQEIVGWIEGATFQESDRPYQHSMRSFRFLMDEFPDEEPIKIEATDPAVAVEIFDQKYNRGTDEIDFYEVITTVTVVQHELPPKGEHAL